MKKTVLLVTLLCSFAVANAQTKREIGNFTKLNVRGSFDVKLVSGGDLTIKSTNADIIKDIKTEVENGTLKIYIDAKRKKHNDEITITVPVKNLDEVVMSGSGSIESDLVLKSESFLAKLSGSGDIGLEINATSVTSEITGSGDVKLKGKATNFTANLSGSGDLEAFGLVAANVEVSVTGSGDAQVQATENLKARVSGSGDISVRGNPKKEDTKVSGSGSIEKD